MATAASEGPGPAVRRQRDQSDDVVRLTADALDLLHQAKALLDELLIRVALGGRPT